MLAILAGQKSLDLLADGDAGQSRGAGDFIFWWIGHSGITIAVPAWGSVTVTRREHLFCPPHVPYFSRREGAPICESWAPRYPDAHRGPPGRIGRHAGERRDILEERTAEPGADRGRVRARWHSWHSLQAIRSTRIERVRENVSRRRIDLAGAELFPILPAVIKNAVIASCTETPAR